MNTKPSPPKRPIADTDIFVLGLRRAGIHAIVSWLIPHLTGVSRLVNDHMFDPDSPDPFKCHFLRYYYSKRGHAGEILMPGLFRDASNRLSRDDAKAFMRSLPLLLRPIPRFVFKKFTRFCRHQPEPEQLIPYSDTHDTMSVDCNVYVVENLTPREFTDTYPEWHRRSYLPWLDARGLSPAPRAMILVVLREPWNQLASLIRNCPSQPPRVITPESFQSKWLEFASALDDGCTVLKPHGEVLPILYPRWFTDADHRAELASALGAAPTESGLNVVSTFGGGSSFENTAMDGRAQQMNVLERWKACADHPLMRELCADPDIATLSERLLGLRPPSIDQP